MYVSKVWESVARRGRKQFIANWGQDVTYGNPLPQGRGQRSKVILLPTSGYYLFVPICRKSRPLLSIQLITGEKLIGSIVDTGEQLITGVVDTGEQFIGGAFDTGDNKKVTKIKYLGVKCTQLNS
jgi:hypothetical protein